MAASVLGGGVAESRARSTPADEYENEDECAHPHPYAHKRVWRRCLSHSKQQLGQDLARATHAVLRIRRSAELDGCSIEQRSQGGEIGRRPHRSRWRAELVDSCACPARVVCRRVEPTIHCPAEQAAQSEPAPADVGDPRGAHGVFLASGGRELAPLITAWLRPKMAQWTPGLHDDAFRWWQHAETTASLVGPLPTAARAVDQRPARSTGDREGADAPAALALR